MYFSKNSRYVLQKAQIFSPKFFKVAGKNLSFKTPEEDLTKPPLRLNVPEDSEENVFRKPHLDEARIECKTSTFPCTTKISSTSISASFDEDIVPQNDKQISLRRVSGTEDVTRDAEELVAKFTAKSPLSGRAKSSEDEGQEALGSGLMEPILLGAGNFPSPEATLSQRNVNSATESPAEDVNSKSLYIIIDIPEKSESKSANESSETVKESAHSAESLLFRAKEKKESAFSEGSKSVSKFSFPKDILKRTRRIDINEIEDAGTYIFHLRINQNPQRRSQIPWMSEKEFEAKPEIPKAPSAPIKITESIPNMTPKVAPTPRTPTTPTSRKPSEGKSEGSRKNKLRSSSTGNLVQKERSPGGKRLGSPTRSPRKAVDVSVVRAERKSPPKVLANDNEPVKWSAKNYPLRLLAKKVKMELGASPEVKAEPPVDPYLEHQSPKAESLLSKSDYLNIHSLREKENELGDTTDNSAPYYKIPKVKSEKKRERSSEAVKKQRRKMGASQTELPTPPSDPTTFDTEAINFRTSASFVSFGCENASSGALKFGVAFPPLLSDALKNRLKFRRNAPDIRKNWAGAEDFKSTKKRETEISENDILFPKKEEFDCEALFTTREDIILNLIKNSETRKAKAEASNSVTSGTDNSPVDTLTVMKKVKEIVQFDLDNVVKIFNDWESKPEKEISSAVVLKGDSWEVDLKELGSQPEKSATDGSTYAPPTETDMKMGILGDEVDRHRSSFKHLPPSHPQEEELRFSEENLDSIVNFDPKTKEFFVSGKVLADAIIRRVEKFDKEIQETPGYLAMEVKKGDSILVFDEETQSWKVDFTILEKREEQQKIEKDLAERSELILQTFEKLEKEQIPSVSMPQTKDKKTFDYKNERWDSLKSDANSKEKARSSKSPFKESDAEEIRKKNSDLFENLFVANKKETMPRKSKTLEKINLFSPAKSQKFRVLAKAEDSSSGGAPQAPVPPSTPPETSESNKAPPPEDKTAPEKEEDNFWGTFLDMNILPRDIREIPKITPPPPPSPHKRVPKGQPSKAPKKPPEAPPVTPLSKIPPAPASKDSPSQIPLPTREPSPAPPASKTPSPTESPPTTAIDPKVIVPPDSEYPSSKIEEPKFRIRFPFIKDKKIDKSAPSKQDSEPPASGSPPSAPDTKDKQIEQSGPPKGSAPPASGSPPATPAIKDKKIEQSEPPKGSAPPASGSASPTPAEKDKKIEPSVPPKDPAPPASKPTSGATITEKPEIKSPSPAKEESIKLPPVVEKSKIDSPKSSPSISTPKTTPAKDSPKIQKAPDPKSTTGGKSALASGHDHYVSDKIVEISRNKPTDTPSKIKTNKIETVKLNITPDKRLPSKVVEINLNKKCEGKAKESKISVSKSISSVDAKKSPKGVVRSSATKINKNLEKYKTPFSDPDYEEKSIKIKSDIESNPNLKKLDGCNKTLVLHDIVKPPENIESWLKDETDKMATLLLKVLQEAADGKPKKKSLIKSKAEKMAGKGNPYDNIRKKQENTPENFLLRVRTVNLSLENQKKSKQEEKGKPKPDNLGDVLLENAKPPQTGASMKIPAAEKYVQTQAPSANVPLPAALEDDKTKASPTPLKTLEESALISNDVSESKQTLDITEEIPGPEILKKISNTWKMFPILGSQLTIFTLLRVYQLVNLGNSLVGSINADRKRRNAFSKLFVKYGPIVNVQGPLSGNVILIHNPEHLASVFDQDITTTTRSVFDSLDHVRREMEENSLTIGISTDWNKSEWHPLKRTTVDPLMVGSVKYFGAVNVAADSLTSNIKRTRNAQNYVSEDFMEDIKRWSLEGLCNVLFEKSFGFLEGRCSSMSWIMEPDKLFMAIGEATGFLNRCERGFQLWRLMSTPSSLGLARVYRNLFAILSKHLYQSEMNLKGKYELLKYGNSLPKNDLSFIEAMLLNDGMTTDEIACNLVDTILIGTNVMNSAMGFLLYNMAQNVKAQVKLFNELKEVLPQKDSILSYDKLSSLKYLQACLKESLRLHFPIPLFFRLLQNDILLSNYIVPKGTCVVMDYRVNSMKEQIFDEPEKFVPERWLQDERWMQNIHPFSALPLCQGPRAEMIKSLVELQLLTCFAKIIRNFQVEYQHGEIHPTDSIISYPDRPLKLNFIDREL